MWAPEHHTTFPPAFRAAVRTLLLVNESRGFGRPAAGWGYSGGRSLGAAAGRERAAMGVRLPGELLQRIVGLAAGPLPVWVPQLQPFVQVD